MKVLNSVLAQSSFPNTDSDKTVAESIGRPLVFNPFNVSGILYDNRIILSKSIFAENNRVAYTISIAKNCNIGFKINDDDTFQKYKAIREFVYTVNHIFSALDQDRLLMIELLPMIKTDKYVVDNYIFETIDGKQYMLYLVIEDKVIQKSTDIPTFIDKRILFGIFDKDTDIISNSPITILNAIQTLSLAGFSADITIFDAGM